MNDRQKTPYPLRMSDELRSDLEEAAKQNKRSVQAEIIARLEESFLWQTESLRPDRAAAQSLALLHRLETQLTASEEEAQKWRKFALRQAITTIEIAPFVPDSEFEKNESLEVTIAEAKEVIRLSMKEWREAPGVLKKMLAAGGKLVSQLVKSFER